MFLLLLANFMKAKPIEFQPPVGIVPEGIGPGEDFDLVTTYRLRENGSCCVVQVGEVKMPGYESKASDNHKPDYSEMADEMAQAAKTQEVRSDEKEAGE